MQAPFSMRSLHQSVIAWLIGVVTLMAALFIMSPSPVLGQTETSSVKMINQSLVIRQGQAFELQLGLNEILQPETTQVVVILHERVITRSRFAQTLDGSNGLPLRRITRPIPALSGSNSDSFPLTIAVLPAGAPDDLNAFPPLEPGVYPVSISIQRIDSSKEVASLATHLIRAPDTNDAPPLRVALIQPFGTTPALTPKGSVALDQTTTSNLEAIASTLEQFSLVPLTLAPIPETLDALATLKSPALTALSKSLNGRQVVARPYVSLDLPALETSTSLDRILAQRTEGLAALNRHLKRRPVERTWVHDGLLNDRNLSELIDLGIDRAIVSEPALAPLSISLTLTRPFVLQDVQGRELTTASIDAALGNHLKNDDDPVLGAYHLIADLAVLYFDSPGTQRGVVLSVPAETIPEALKALLSSLVNSPALIKPVTLDGLFEEVERETDAKGAPLVRRLTRTKPSKSQSPNTTDTNLREDLESISTLIGPDDKEVNLAKRLFLVSDASNLSAQEHGQYVVQAQKLVSNVTERIRIVDRGTYRLTDHEGTVPITLTNTSPGSPAKVQLRLESEKLEFLNGNANQPGVFTKTLVLNKANTTLEVPVRYRTPGAFPLLIKVTTPDGQLLLVEGRFEVRSTAISGVGVLLSLGTGAFLLLWWVRHWRSTRRAKHLVIRPDPT